MNYRSILKKIKPSESEAKKVRAFSEKLLSTAKKVSGLEAVICGSLGKGTWLSGNHDIDVFILFPKEIRRGELEKKGLEFGARVAKEMKGRYRVSYAEHPYTKADIQGFTVDIVPCYRIEKGERIISAVDRSPLHLEFVRENLRDDIKDEVLLLKQFCKSTGMYGSDAKTLGFSGYICELLVLKYGSFEKVIKAAAEWHLPCVIDLAGKSAPYHKEIFVVIDPTDIHRNAAAIVSPYSIMKFIYSAKRFARNPSGRFFEMLKLQPLSGREIKALRKRETHFFCLSMKRPDVVDDVLYQQARRGLARISGILRQNGFEVMRSYEFIGKNILMFFEIRNGMLPAVKKMVGPPLFARKHVAEFTAKYGGAYLEGINVAADREREYRMPSSLLKDMMKKDSKTLAEMGIPSNIIIPFRSANILEGNAFFPLLKEREFSDFLRRMYFEKII